MKYFIDKLGEGKVKRETRDIVEVDELESIRTKEEEWVLGKKLGCLEIMRYIREVFEEEWLGWKDSKDDRERDIWCNGWLERYGVVAGALYLEERYEDKKFRPTSGILVGIRGRGRVWEDIRKSKKRVRRGRRRVYLHNRRIVKLDEKLKKLYIDKRKVDGKIEIEEIERLNRDKLGKLELLVRSILTGRRVYIGTLDGERFIIHKKGWIENKSKESSRADLRVKYLVRWEHIGKNKKWKHESTRFIKEKLD